MEGTSFGRYQLVDLLGRGGMGEVWRAYDTAMDRVVALKMLPTEFASDETFQQRFRREARAAAGLNEPHVVPIFDFGDIDGRLYVTMRLIEGQDLQAIVRYGALAPARAVGIIEQIGSALHAAHRIGLVHRDVKPSNILVAEDDFAYLIDFGIARLVGETGLTSTGSTIGTWAYMAPERFQTGKPDSRADVYALTCVLYECLTGQIPFPADSVEQIVVAHMFQPPPRPSVLGIGVPAAMDDVIATGMAKDPDHRYPTTKDLASAARHAVFGTVGPPHRPPAAPVQPATEPTQPVYRGSVPATFVRDSLPQRPIEPSAPGGDGRRPRSTRARFLVPALAAVVVVAALVVGAVIISSKPAETRTAAPSQTKTAEKVAGPLDGTYRVEYGPDTKFSGSPHHDASPAYAPAVEEWAIRSTCPNTGCVATAARESSNAVPHDLSTPIFDEVSGRWVAVGVEPAGTCNGRSSEVWTAMTLQGQPDGTLSGELTYTSPLVCAGKRTVVFTRTGDVTANDVADPATEAPRVASPAQPLYGQYRWVQHFSDGSVAPVEYHYAVSTECVRTGERCLSYLFSASSDVGDALSFANDAWTKNISHDEPCPSGNGDSHSVDTAEFPLPQPLQNPITLLVGHGHHDNGGGCSFATDFDVRLERTGD